MKWATEFFDWIGNCHEQIKILATIIVACWAYWLFVDEVKKNRVSESLEYIERIQKGEMLESKMALITPLITIRGMVALNSIDMEDWPDHAKSYVQENNLEKHVYNLMSFYKDLSICSNNGVCDEKTLCQFFQRDVSAFQNLYSDLFRSWGEAWAEDLTLELKSFSYRCEQRDYIKARIVLNIPP